MPTEESVVKLIVQSYAQTQAIYLFGSHGTPDERKDGDVDVAILLPALDAKLVGSLALSPLRQGLERILRKDVDLVNLREVSTVFQKEIIMANRRIYCADSYAVDEFEMLVLSFYCKLNEEREEILTEFARTGRAYPV